METSDAELSTFSSWQVPYFCLTLVEKAAEVAPKQVIMLCCALCAVVCSVVMEECTPSSFIHEKSGSRESAEGESAAISVI